MNEIKDNDIMKNILDCAMDVSEDIDELLRISDEAGKNAGIYSEKIALTAALLRQDTCSHMRELIDDMEKSVKIKL